MKWIHNETVNINGQQQNLLVLKWKCYQNHLKLNKFCCCYIISGLLWGHNYKNLQCNGEIQQKTLNKTCAYRFFFAIHCPESAVGGGDMKSRRIDQQPLPVNLYVVDSDNPI